MGCRRISIDLDEDTLDVARSYAAKRHLTLSGLVEAFLKGIAEREQRALAARAKIHAVRRVRPPSEDDG